MNPEQFPQNGTDPLEGQETSQEAAVQSGDTNSEHSLEDPFEGASHALQAFTTDEQLAATRAQVIKHLEEGGEEATV